MGVYESSKKFVLIKKEEHSKVVKELQDLKLISTAMRPLNDDRTFSNNRNVIGLNNFNFKYITLRHLFELFRFSDILQLVFNARASETFRRGFEKKIKSFEGNQDQLKRCDSIIKEANNNGQTLIEVLTMCDKDLNWADDMFILISKNYRINKNNEIIGADVVEILRLNPLTVEMVIDKFNRLGFDDEMGKVYFEITKRSARTENAVNDKTGLPNLQAHYRVWSSDGWLYYNKTEIIHKSDFNPSETYGFSPLFSLYPKTQILLTQDDFIRKYYGTDKPPKGFMIFNTDNSEKLLDVMDKVHAKTRENPHSVYPIPFKSVDGKDPVQFIDMSRSLQEMQFTEGRTELRQQIGAMYGVSSVFQNDASGGGGLNNEGLQIKVTNRHIEKRQNLWNQVLEIIFKDNLGITDWTINLLPSEEKDEVAELERQSKKIANAKALMDLGIKGKFDESGEFIFRAGELELKKTENVFSPLEQNEDNSNHDIPDTPDTEKSLNSVIDVKKAEEKPLPVRAQKTFETNLQKDLKKILSKLNLKKKPTEKQLNDIVKEAIDNLDKQLKTKSALRIKAVYRKALNKTSRELNQQFTLQAQDRNIIEALKRAPVFADAFKGLSDEISDRLKKVVKEAFKKPEGFTIDKIVEEMKDEVDKSNSRLRNIARTESSKISSAARSVSYDKVGKDNFLFKHIGPSDNRETDTSKRIKNLVGKGVSWEKYVQIIKTESKKEFPKWEVNEEAPVSHYQSRHTFVGIRKK